jgi:hypothetical protein
MVPHGELDRFLRLIPKPVIRKKSWYSTIRKSAAIARDFLALLLTMAVIVGVVHGIEILKDLHDEMTRPPVLSGQALPSEAEVRRLEQKADAIDKALKKLGPRIERREK